VVADQPDEALVVDRLDEMDIEAGRRRAPPVVVAAVAGHGDQKDGAAQRRPDPLGHRVAVDARQADVDEDKSA